MATKTLNYFSNLKQGFKFKNYALYIFLVIFVVIAGILVNTGVIARSDVIIFEQIGYSIISVISLSLVVGFLGELSLGHAGFMSIGAYFGVAAQQIFFPGLTKAAPLLGLLLALIIGGLVAAIFGLIIGLPTLRLKGDYLAIVTLAFGEIVKVLFQHVLPDVFGGTLGLKNKFRYDYHFLFIIIFVVAILVIALIKNLIKSKHGRSIMAIRDNEIAAKAMGVDATYYKLFVFILSAFLAGIAGVFFGASQNVVTASTFDYNYSINNILVMVVIGGMGNINGSIISAIVVTFINIKLQTYITGDLAPLRQIIFAVILVGIVIYSNAPGLKHFREKYNFKKVTDFIKQKLVKIPFFAKVLSDNPSVEKDFNGDWSKIPTKIKMDAILSKDLELATDLDKPDKPIKEDK